jgi:ABC-type bacteriocin/lantibiotic exporter with double-glycine peptidase domain
MAFSALTLFFLLDQPMIGFVDGSEDLMAVVNCFQRIQKHLLDTERIDCRTTHAAESSRLIDVETVEWQDDYGLSCAVARDLSAAWSVDNEPVLKKLNFAITTGLITMIVGPVGCGKSTLLRALLGEVPEASGTISTTFKNAAYCSQSPWITFGTIRQNVVGASPWDQKWYDTIIQACSLQMDLQQLPSGDQTKVGVRGSRLSGGQQMRVVSFQHTWGRTRLLAYIKSRHWRERSTLESLSFCLTMY